MSVISVAWNQADEPPVQNLQNSITAAQSLYATGRAFFWSDNHISLGGILSDFLPEDQFDAQPLWAPDRSFCLIAAVGSEAEVAHLWAPDRSFCLIADVRLDNRSDLARELSLNNPSELSDSSFLFAAWMRWGPACLDRIIGGFSFAVWTPSRQELFAARDHAGERPLFYHRRNGLFALASMPKGLLAIPGAFNGFNETRIVNWLGYADQDWKTSFFNGIERLPLGHFIRVTPDSFECRQYWHPTKARRTRYKNDRDYTDALLEIFDRATEARLRTNKPIGSFLSAGLDSSSVTASAARLLAAQGKSLTAFTSVPRPDFNHISEPWNLPSEGEEASAIARLYPNIEHVLVDHSGRDLLHTMKRWTDAMDEPALNVVNLMWITAILEQASQRGISVMLEGLSGNGTISWEPQAIYAYLFRRLRWVQLFRTTHTLRKNGGTSIRNAVRHAFAGFIPEGLERRLIPASVMQNVFPPLVNPELTHASALGNRIFKSRFRNVADPSQEQAKILDNFDFSPLHAATQALSHVEVRDPTADKRVYDFCFSIPPEQYVAGGHTRSLVRRAMQQRLPQATLKRYARGYQSADWYLPVKEALPSLREEQENIEQSPAARRLLDLQRLREVRETFPDSGYHTNRVYEGWHLSLICPTSMGYFVRSHDPAAVQPAPDPTTPLAAPLK